MSRAELKQKARAQLGNGIFSNNWLMALLVCFITGAILSAAAGITYGIASIIVAGPLAYGAAHLFLKQARDGEGMKLEGLFCGFKEDFGGNILLALLIGVFTMLWSLLFVIPGIVKAYSYSMAFYIKNDHPDYDWRRCIAESKAMMNGHKMEKFILDLSFLGWLIVGTLCLGVGVLWVEPYMFATEAQFYEKLRQSSETI